MHELAIAEAILRSALAELRAHRPARLARVRIVAGRLLALVPDNLRMAFDVVSRDTPAAGAALEVRAAPVTARCRRCGRTGPIRGSMFACGACGSGDLAIAGGKDLYLESLDLEMPDADAPD